MEGSLSSEDQRHHTNATDDEHLYDPFDYVTAVNMAKLLMSRQAPVSELGYSEIMYSFCEDEETKKKKKGKVDGLRAIIPSSSQREILRALKGSQSSRDMKTGHRESILSRTDLTQPRPVSAARLFIGAKMQPEKKKIKIRLDDDGNPVFMELPKGKKKVYDLLKQYEDDKEKRKQHMKALSKRRAGDEFIDDDGVAYFYGENGRKVSAEELLKEEEERKARIAARRQERILSIWNVLHNEKQKKVLEGELVHKTREWVKETQVLAAEETRAGQPHTFQGNPSTTFPLKKDMPILPKEAIKMWPEYAQLEPDDVIVTIEYCRGCADHQWGTHHDEENYLSIAEDIKFILTQLAEGYAIRFAALMKPITREQATRKGEVVPPNVVLGVDVTKRIGAMEIQMAIRTSGETIVHILHSKLFRECWPNLSLVRRTAETIFRQLGLKRFKRETETAATAEETRGQLRRSSSLRSSSVRSLTGSKSARKLHETLKKSGSATISAAPVSASAQPPSSSKPKPALPYAFDRRPETLRHNRLHLMDELLHIAPSQDTSDVAAVIDASAGNAGANGVGIGSGDALPSPLATGRSLHSKRISSPPSLTPIVDATDLGEATKEDDERDVEAIRNGRDGGQTQSAHAQEKGEDQAQCKSTVTSASRGGEDSAVEHRPAVGDDENERPEDVAHSPVQSTSARISHTGSRRASDSHVSLGEVTHSTAREPVTSGLQPVDTNMDANESPNATSATSAALAAAPAVPTVAAIPIPTTVAAKESPSANVPAVLSKNATTHVQATPKTDANSSTSGLAAAANNTTPPSVPVQQQQQQPAVVVAAAVAARTLTASSTLQSAEEKGQERRSSVSSISSMSDADVAAKHSIATSAIEKAASNALSRQESNSRRANQESTDVAASNTDHNNNKEGRLTETNKDAISGSSIAASIESRRSRSSSNSRVDTKAAVAVAVDIAAAATAAAAKVSPGLTGKIGSPSASAAKGSPEGSSTPLMKPIPPPQDSTAGSPAAPSPQIQGQSPVKFGTPSRRGSNRKLSSGSLRGMGSPRRKSSSQLLKPSPPIVAAAGGSPDSNSSSRRSSAPAVVAPSFETTFTKFLHDSEQRFSEEVRRNSDFELKMATMLPPTADADEDDPNRPVPTQELLSELQDLLHSQSSVSSDAGDYDEMDYYGDARTSSRRGSAIGRRGSTDSALASVKEEDYEDDFEADGEKVAEGAAVKKTRRASHLLAGKSHLEKVDDDEEDKYSDDADHVKSPTAAEGAKISPSGAGSGAGRSRSGSASKVGATPQKDEEKTKTLAGRDRAGSGGSIKNSTRKGSQDATITLNNDRLSKSPSNGRMSPKPNGRSSPKSNGLTSPKSGSKSESKSQSRRASKDDDGDDDEEMDLEEALFGRKASLKPKGGGASPKAAGGARRGLMPKKTMSSLSNSSLDDDFLDDLSFDARLTQFGVGKGPEKISPEGADARTDGRTDGAVSDISAQGSAESKDK